MEHEGIALPSSWEEYAEMRRELGDEAYKMETPEEWWPTLKKMVADLRKLPNSELLIIDQIKEKFGGLRVYYTTQELTPTMLAKLKVQNNNKHPEVVINELLREVDSLIFQAEEDIQELKNG